MHKSIENKSTNNPYQQFESFKTNMTRQPKIELVEVEIGPKKGKFEAYKILETKLYFILTPP